MNYLYRIVTLLTRPLEWVLWVLFLWITSGLFWQLASPSPSAQKLYLPRPVPTLTRSGMAILNEWFVVAPDKNKKQQPAPIDWKLQAVVSGPQGIAILSGVQANPIAVRVGGEIEPGTRLVSVEANQIWVEREGQRQALALSTISPSNPSTMTPGSRAKHQVEEAPSTTQQSLSRHQIAAALQGGNMANWDKGVSPSPDGGLRIDAANVQPLSRIFQLKDGDVIKSINQRSLSQVADVSLIYNAFQQSSLELVVIRDHRPYTLRYQVQP